MMKEIERNGNVKFARDYISSTETISKPKYSFTQLVQTTVFQLFLCKVENVAKFSGWQENKKICWKRCMFAIPALEVEDKKGEIF